MVELINHHLLRSELGFQATFGEHDLSAGFKVGHSLGLEGTQIQIDRLALLADVHEDQQALAIDLAGPDAEWLAHFDGAVLGFWHSHQPWFETLEQLRGLHDAVPNRR